MRDDLKRLLKYGTRIRIVDEHSLTRPCFPTGTLYSASTADYRTVAASRGHLFFVLGSLSPLYDSCSVRSIEIE